MYRESARYYDAIYSFKDYAVEADAVSSRIRALKPDAATLLDVACGTGAHLVPFARKFPVVFTMFSQNANPAGSGSRRK